MYKKPTTVYISQDSKQWLEEYDVALSREQEELAMMYTQKRTKTASAEDKARDIGASYTVLPRNKSHLMHHDSLKDGLSND
jgi:ornithine carbamoyltransferase